jgi:uncharacterized protein (UPF0276 family)
MATLSPSSLPFLGAGLGYRRAIRGFYRQHRDRIGFLEVMPEHILDAAPAARAELHADCAGFPVVTHSVTLSVGTATGPDTAFLPKLARISRTLKAPWCSDHLCFTKVDGRTIGQLTPLPYTDESLAAVVRNVKAVQRAVGIPFLVENISQYFQFPGNTLSEPEFFAEVTRKTGCGALLDVTNLRNNAANLGTDPERYLTEFPLERLVQFHLAGSEWVDGHLLDTHGAAIHPEVWAMTQRVIANSDVRALLIERDQTFGPLPQLAGELKRAHKLMQGASGA